MKELLKFIDEHITATLVFCSLIGGLLLIAIGKIPTVIPINEYTIFTGTTIGLYVAYTTSKKFAKKKE